MPITARPDPNNPGQWIWVDQTTGEPAVQPGGPNTSYVAPSDLTDQQRQQLGMPPKPQPAAATPAAPTATQTAATSASAAGQNAPQVGAAQGQGGMFTVDQATSSAAQEVQQANLNVAAMWDQINKAQQTVDQIQQSGDTVAIAQQLPSATTNLDSLYSTLSAAEQRVETANAAYSTAIQAAVKNNTVDPSQINLANSQSANADAQAAQAKAQAQVLTDGAPGQRALVAAQATQASAGAAASQATADATTAKTPAEVAQLTAQANGLNAQADQTRALLPGLVQKQTAETGLTQAQTALTAGPQSDYYTAQANAQNAQADLTKQQTLAAQATLAAGGPQATVAATQAQAAANQATAQSTLAGIQQKQLGPVYGLQDQINAIKAIQQQVFGPGGSGNPSEANDLLQQFTTATIGGTTPFEAAKAAATQQGVNYGTQMAGVNALQSAQATRAGQYANLAGGALGTLEQMNAYAPKGSQAMAGAFQSVLDYMGSKLAQPQFAPVNIPQAPPMPSFLQGFAQGNSIGQQQGVAQAQGGGGGGQSPTINVNVNGQPQGPGAGAAFNPQASTTAMNALGFMDTPQGRAMASGLGGGAPAAGTIPTNAQAPAPYPGAPSPYATPPPITYPPTGGAAQTPAQQFAQGFANNQPNYPNVLQQYGLNMPSPMQMLGGQPYAGMPLR